MDKFLEDLKNYAEVATDQSFKNMTTLKIGGTARYVAYPSDGIALDSLIRVIREYSKPFKILGKGSDVLCSDELFDGVIIRLDRHFHSCYFDDDIVTAQAGASLIALSVQAMKKGLSGLEFASGIPGTVGGALFMNAGAYRSSMSEIVTEVLVYKNGNFEWMKNEDCCFSYRASIFQEHPDWIITACRMQLHYKDKKEIRELMDDRRNRRMKSQPLDYPSCGSVFRNPEGMNAWQLIEGIGYRGKRLGDAFVSDKHCNFILNMGDAAASDYLQLVNEIKEKVKEKYDIDLHTEMELFNWK